MAAPSASASGTGADVKIKAEARAKELVDKRLMALIGQFKASQAGHNSTSIFADAAARDCVIENTMQAASDIAVILEAERLRTETLENESHDAAMAHLGKAMALLSLKTPKHEGDPPAP